MVLALSLGMRTGFSMYLPGCTELPNIRELVSAYPLQERLQKIITVISGPKAGRVRVQDLRLCCLLSRLPPVLFASLTGTRFAHRHSLRSCCFTQRRKGQRRKINPSHRASRKKEIFDMNLNPLI